MKSNLSPQQIETYREDGFLVIEEFLSEHELFTWRDAIDESVSQRVGSHTISEPGGSQDTHYENVFVQCVNLWQSNTDMRSLVLDRRLGKLAADLTGARGMHLYHDHALIKQPWANSTNWHVDNPYDAFHSPNQIMLWIAIDEATIQNGCLYFLPGTHKTSRFETSNLEGLDKPDIGCLFRVYPEWATIEPAATPMKAGSCVFISGMIAHAAGPNMTNLPRRAMSLVFMPQGATFNGRNTVMPDALVEKLKVGDVIEDDEVFPLLYSLPE